MHFAECHLVLNSYCLLSFGHSECNRVNERVYKFPVKKRLKDIRIYNECEGKIEKSIPRITVWHHEACRMITNGDPEGRIFLSYPHTNNRLFFLLTTCFYFK